MTALIEALPALLVIAGFLIELGAIVSRLSRIAAAIEDANELTRDAWRDKYLEGRIEKPKPIRGPR